MLTHEQSTIALDLVGATGLEAEMCALHMWEARAYHEDNYKGSDINSSS